MERVTLYTDGSASLKEGKGGWAVVGLVNGRKALEAHGHLPKATSQSAELMAVLSGLRLLTVDDDRPVRVMTDSQYVIRVKDYRDVLASQWPFGRPVKNQKIVKRIHKRLALLRKTRTVSFFWLRGHSGHEHNERADVLATQGRTGTTAKIVKEHY